MVAARKGYRLTVVIPDNASEERIGLLRLFGAEIVFSDGEKGTNGSIEVARALARRRQVLHAVPVREPGQPAGAPGGHRAGDHPRPARGDPLRRGHGHRGHAHRQRPRAARPQPRHQGRSPPSPSSATWSTACARSTPGSSRRSSIRSEIDRKFLVDSTNSLRTNRELTSKEGIFAGISSGAVVYVAQRIASEIDEGDIVCLLPDGGWKYLSTEAWARRSRNGREGRRGVAVVVNG